MNAQRGMFVALVFAVALAASPASATFPGANGEIAYRTSVEQVVSIVGTVSGRLTAPTPGSESDGSPRWSRDGRQLAFIRAGAVHKLMMLDLDTGELREVINANAPELGAGPSFHGFVGPAWTDDGRISFVFWDASSGNGFRHGIYTVATDGTGLTRTVSELTPNSKDVAEWKLVEPDWSASGRLVYPCFKKETPTATLETLIDTCVFDRHTRTTTRLGVKSEHPRWSPLGDEIVYVGPAFNPSPGGGGFLTKEIFAIAAGGGELPRRLTFTQAASCSTSAEPVLTQVTRAVPSPDGESILFRGVYGRSLDGSTCTTTQGLWTIPADGGPGTLIVEDRFSDHPDWQPRVPKLTVQVDDGHDHPLRGLRVELRTLQGAVVSDDPVNSEGGVYVFADAAPGIWLIRATLVDAGHAAGETPSFDVRHAVTPEEATAPVWVEREVTIADGVESVVAGLSITDGPHVVLSSVSPNARHRLDDMANVFFRMRQFVDWVKAELTPFTGATVELYTFATSDPTSGAPFGSHAAHYVPSATAIVLGTVESEYANRDGVLDLDHENNAPENSEWHEFTHHLYETYVLTSDTTGESHAGYPNPDTSDSLDEGFAMFLPAVAANEIEGTSDAQYDNSHDLEWHHKAWAPGFEPDGGYVEGKTRETIAVAALLWDLVDGAADSQDTAVIAASGAHRPVTLVDEVQLGIGELWDIVTTARPFTVMALRDALGRDPADVTLDLDADLLADIAVVDEVFLMHGFFPIAGDQTISDTHKSHHYDVAFAQHEDPAAQRNGAVGRTDHRTYDSLGDVVDEQIPRFKIPPDPKANVLVELRDETGTPLTGDATLVVTIHYPGGREETRTHRLAGGGALVHLELPPYVDYRLPIGTSVPECDPANDVRVEVSLAVSIGDVTSADQPSFDNCTFQRARETATGPAALAFTFTFPGPPGTTTTTTTSSTTSTTLPPPGPNACAGAKLNAAGKTASCLLAQHAKAAKSGDPLDPTKTEACTAKLASAFAKAEQKKAPCLTVGDAAALQATIDGFAAGITSAIDVAPDPSTCQSKKLKAAGTAAQCLLALEAKAAAKGSPKDPAKITGCTDVLARAFGKAEGGGDCGAATGDATTIGTRIEQLVGDVVTALVPR